MRQHSAKCPGTSRSRPGLRRPVPPSACSIEPNSSMIRVAIGRVYLNQYRYQQALDLFAEATTSDPGHAKALEWRVAALRALRRFAEAETAARTAIGDWPDRPD